ncbi:hypothetical protein ACIL82_04310 [Enterococcus faecium]
MLFNLASHFDIDHGFIPMVLALITSFQSGPPVNMTFNGLGNYQRMLTDATFKKLFQYVPVFTSSSTNHAVSSAFYLQPFK